MIGNPLNDGRWTYTWEHGRQLASITDGSTTVDYVYNSDGLRTQKTVTTSNSHTHVFQNTVVAPTCTENGHTRHVCSCGYIYQDTPVAATGHTYTTSVVADTCTTNGYTLYTCSCGYSYQDGAPGHTFTTLVVAPTETVNGFTKHECECGYSYQSAPVASLASGASSGESGTTEVAVYDYVYNGSSLTQLTVTSGEDDAETLYFAYDGSSPMSVTYNGTNYYYATNLQGDVVAILNSSGTAVVQYTYDAWGNILTTTGSMASTLGAVNPLTYRGYVFDRETGLYYLQSRYYNPEIGRFINADAFASTGQGFLGCNMFTYCNNSPIIHADYLGSKAVNCSMICFVEGAYVRHFGQGTAISMSIYNQSIYIDAYMTFYGDLDPASLIAGIKEYWEGTYTNGTYTYNVFINIHYGESKNGNTVSVYAYTDDFRGYCTWNPFTWGATKESVIVISSDYYSSVSYGWTMAHEFGHSLGVSDYYTQKSAPGFDASYSSIMNLPGVHANFYDVLKVIDANMYGIRQQWYCIGGL